MKKTCTLGQLAIVLIICAWAIACSSAPPQPAAQVPPPVDPAAIEKQIRSMDADWSHAATLGDLDASVSYYADDGAMLAPNAPIASGKAAVRNAWDGLLHMPGYVSLSFSPTSVTVAQAGDIAYEIGTYVLTVKDKKGTPTADNGKYVVVWKKQVDGAWKVEADIFNSGQ